MTEKPGPGGPWGPDRTPVKVIRDARFLAGLVAKNPLMVELWKPTTMRRAVDLVEEAIELPELSVRDRVRLVTLIETLRRGDLAVVASTMDAEKHARDQTAGIEDDLAAKLRDAVHDARDVARGVGATRRSPSDPAPPE